MRRRLTERVVQKLKVPEVGYKITWDEQLAGFGVQVSCQGGRAFVIQYTLFGRERRYTIGRWPIWTAEAAREKALDLKRGLLQGEDPHDVRNSNRQAKRFADLSVEYLKHGQTYKRASSLYNERQMLEGILLPRWGQLQLKAISRRDVEQLHAELQATPYKANRVLAMLSTMFNLGQNWGWCEANPVKGVKRYHEEPREVWLQTEELAQLHQALDDYEDQSAANALRLIILTGARKSEVLRADWTMFDLVRGVWTKPSHHTKQKKVEHVPLSREAVKVLQKMRPRKEGPLFPGKKREKSRVSLRRPWAQVCRVAGLTQAVTVKGRRRTTTRHKPRVRVHDLRHTFASYLVSDGVGLRVVGKLLGHSQAQTTERYAHVLDEPLRAATNRFGKLTRAPRRKGRK